ncbi:MAG: hypothetical protein UX86_C0011G0008 [Candidatus Amesbacteria bacterium GW2011_GWC1_47_15]|uniref:Uncharacterized protein n=5 Tax=Candidatus Amesiibacteriota TaxID=1752730 RepID=A0A0G1V2L9_9BACT|nr:MAG: hypothetical protein UX86_C0011G0008 [Candidatus Amesbacteria bacterium GW2011_GWC1_47_15]KKU98434.1 MAG: hypothetical protein UY28_C0002G0039 [Candidatus Amesbacteria bacterium GW2011_GWB1_48_13]
MNYNGLGVILCSMARKKPQAAKSRSQKNNKSQTARVVTADTAAPKWLEERQTGINEDGILAVDQLDPQEEKVLDWILKIVVGFILGWLGLSILLVLGGLFNLWG